MSEKITRDTSVSKAIEINRGAGSIIDKHFSLEPGTSNPGIFIRIGSVASSLNIEEKTVTNLLKELNNGY